LEFNGLRRQKLSKYLTQTFMSHCNEMICQQVTLSGYAEWPKVADAVIEAVFPTDKFSACLLSTACRAGEHPVALYRSRHIIFRCSIRPCLCPTASQKKGGPASISDHPFEANTQKIPRSLTQSVGSLFFLNQFPRLLANVPVSDILMDHELCEITVV
jgi:hypothetical protein